MVMIPQEVFNAMLLSDLESLIDQNKNACPEILDKIDDLIDEYAANTHDEFQFFPPMIESWNLDQLKQALKECPPGYWKNEIRMKIKVTEALKGE